jgi:hypothetical protein
MRCQWIVRRTMRPDPDGQRRWDRAYRDVLSWTKEQAVASAGASHGPGAREDGHEGGALCPGCLIAPPRSMPLRFSSTRGGSGSDLTDTVGLAWCKRDGQRGAGLSVDGTKAQLSAARRGQAPQPRNARGAAGAGLDRGVPGRGRLAWAVPRASDRMRTARSRIGFSLFRSPQRRRPTGSGLSSRSRSMPPPHDGVRAEDPTMSPNAVLRPQRA